MALGEQDVELAVVELGVGEEHHAAAVGTGVPDLPRSSRPARARSASTVTVSAPAAEGERPQGRMGVHGVAPDQPGLVGDPVGVRVEAEARDSHERRAVHVGDVDQPLIALGSDAGRLGGDHRHPEYASEVIAAPAGDERERRLAAAQRGGERPQQPVAPMATTVSAWSAARAASCSACSMLRVVTVR